MDPQRIEAKLLRDVNKAEKAWLAEEDEAKSEKLEKIWLRAREELNSFQRQQVAGGEDSNQGCQGLTFMSCSSRWCTCCPGPCPPGLAEALKPGHARDVCTGDICTCSIHPTG